MKRTTIIATIFFIISCYGSIQSQKTIREFTTVIGDETFYYVEQSGTNGNKKDTVVKLDKVVTKTPTLTTKKIEINSTKRDDKPVSTTKENKKEETLGDTKLNIDLGKKEEKTDKNSESKTETKNEIKKDSGEKSDNDKKDFNRDDFDVADANEVKNQKGISGKYTCMDKKTNKPIDFTGKSDAEILDYANKNKDNIQWLVKKANKGSKDIIKTNSDDKKDSGEKLNNNNDNDKDGKDKSPKDKNSGSKDGDNNPKVKSPKDNDRRLTILDSLCFDSDVCFGYGDPHYLSFDGNKFSIQDSCSYILATDGCDSLQSSYKIIINHEKLNLNSPNVSAIIKSVEVHHNSNVYRIGLNQLFTVNNDIFDLLTEDFISDDSLIRVFKSAHFTVIDSKAFNVQYDGIQFLKVRECGFKVCGICGNHNKNLEDDEISFDKYLAETNEDAECIPKK